MNRFFAFVTVPIRVIASVFCEAIFSIKRLLHRYSDQKYSKLLAMTLKIFIFLYFTSNVWAQVDEAQLTVQFHQAGISYKAKDYQKAIELYEGIVKTGWGNGALFYNLGNSYFKDGQLGKAILNYERARRLTPRDPDLNSNDQYAISQMKNPESSMPQPLVNRAMNHYADFFTLDELTLMVFFFFFLTGIFYFLGLFLKWPPKIRLFWILVCCFLLFFHGFILAHKIGQQKNLAVVLSDTPARFEPLPGATAYFELTPGGKVKILTKEGDWLKVKRLDGKVGWVNAEVVERI